MKFYTAAYNTITTCGRMRDIQQQTWINSWSDRLKHWALNADHAETGIKYI